MVRILLWQIKQVNISRISLGFKVNTLTFTGDSVDCRRDDEKQRIKKSRYGTIDCYISDKGEHFNDIEVVYNKEYYDKLRANGVDHLLAQVGVFYVYYVKPRQTFTTPQQQLRAKSNFASM